MPLAPGVLVYRVAVPQAASLSLQEMSPQMGKRI